MWVSCSLKGPHPAASRPPSPCAGKALRAAEGNPTREKHPDARETRDVPSYAATFQAMLRRSKLCCDPYSGDGGTTPPSSSGRNTLDATSPCTGEVSGCRGRQPLLREGRHAGLFLPQRGRISAQLTGEGELARIIRRQSSSLLPHPSAASREIGGCHLSPLGEGFCGRLIATPTAGEGHPCLP